MLLRPKPGDTEEDILLMQEQFMKSGNLPSASLSKTGFNKKGGLRAPQSRVDCTGRVISWILDKVILQLYGHIIYYICHLGYHFNNRYQTLSICS